MPLIDPEAYLTEVLTRLAAPHVLDPITLPLARSAGAVLAEDATAAVPVPPWTNSAMDGYAVRADDVATARPDAPVTLPVAGDVPAGAAPGRLEPGTAARIMTGAALPDGADAVVRVEDTDQEPGPHPLPTAVQVLRSVTSGANVRRAGEDVRAGDPVLAAGTRLTARAWAALASAGRGAVRVRPAVRVGVVSTGAELTDPGQPLTPGRIPDSNGLLLAGLVQEAGGKVTRVVRAGDSAASLAQALAEAAHDADLVITSGGVSAGAFDPLTMLAAAQDAVAAGAQDADGGALVADLTFRKVAMQPGKPQGYGTLTVPASQDRPSRTVPLLMMPGNPVSVLVSFTLFARPLLAALAGADDAARLALPVPRARAAAAWTCPPGRRQYVPVRLVTPDSLAASVTTRPGATTAPAAVASEPGLWVAPVHRLGSGSHLVASLATATALAIVPAEQEAVEVGEVLGLLPLA